MAKRLAATASVEFAFKAVGGNFLRGGEQNHFVDLKRLAIIAPRFASRFYSLVFTWRD